MPRLSEYIHGYATKVLSPVDLPGRGSNQHELNGVKSLKEFLGGQKLAGQIRWYYFDDSGITAHSSGTFTFYDARARPRTEWRLYYSDSTALAAAKSGDLLVITRARGDDRKHLIGFVFSKSSSWREQAPLLFGGFGVAIRAETGESIQGRSLGLAENIILGLLEEALGVQKHSAPARARRLVDTHFPKDLFPSTDELARLARETSAVGAKADADAKLSAWLDNEEILFLALEERIVGSRIRQPRPFATVDEFIRYSLGVQNRRKSRRGKSLEHHLHELFTTAGLQFDHPGVTEGRQSPDFLFPGSRTYKRPREHLFMLAAKTTCKDRWRQILAEADRIPNKHLCTLEPAISEHQTREMTERKVQLVIPRGLHHTYTQLQRRNILKISGFIELVAKSQ